MVPKSFKQDLRSDIKTDVIESFQPRKSLEIPKPYNHTSLLKNIITPGGGGLIGQSIKQLLGRHFSIKKKN